MSNGIGWIDHASSLSKSALSCQADVRERPISTLDDVVNWPDGWRLKFDPELGENWDEL